MTLKELLGFPKLFLIFWHEKQFFFIALVFGFWNCSNDDNDLLNTAYTGVVKNRTSCTGGPEPVYIVYVESSNEIDSIMTGTLNDEFQVEELKITFRIRPPKNLVACTQDKFHPRHYNVDLHN